MAQYIFVKTRQSVQPSSMLHKLEQVCGLLTPVAIKGQSQNTVAEWPAAECGFYAIQNSESVAQLEQGALVIGWLQQADLCNSEADGSYAVIKSSTDEVSFFSDQFGSRTLWYYLDENTLIVSTSQRAVVALKGSFQLNKEALAWYLSSGCQGPLISWDQEIQQVLPNLEYQLQVADWTFVSHQKPGMQLPPSGSTKMSDYLALYEKEVTAALAQVVKSYPEGQVLLPLSGGLDSRLLLALSKHAGLDKKVGLVNWGVPTARGVFDDKSAAQKVAAFYGKELLDMSLPAQIDEYDQVLDHFVEASEGRIDHFNAFADGFALWTEIFQQGYRMIVRGDIPYPGGLFLNKGQLRAFMGLELLSDYVNYSDFSVQKYAELQNEKLTQRLGGESLTRWRDRAYVGIRVPIVLAAFSQQISSFTENRTPMFNWSLFKLYMGLPDKDKGRKLHIKKLWKKYDHSAVSSGAMWSLRPMNAYFENRQGQAYLLRKLAVLEDSSYFSAGLVKSVYQLFSQQEQRQAAANNVTVRQEARAWLLKNLPALLKAYLKTKQAKMLSATTMAYRVVLIEKIINMYASDAQLLKERD